MKNSRLFKMLVVAFALQGSQLLSIPVFKNNANGGDSYQSIKEELEQATGKSRKAIIHKLLNYVYEDKDDSVRMAYVNANFKLKALEAEVKSGKLSDLANTIYKIGSNRKVQLGTLGTILTVTGIIAAYKNRNAIRTNVAKAGNYLKNTKAVKATSSAVSSAANSVGSARVVTKPTEWIKNGYSWVKSKTPAFPSYGQLKSLTTASVPSK